MSVPVLIGAPPTGPNKNSITYRGLNVNNAADEEKSTYVIEDVIESIAWQQSIEPYPDRDGSQVYSPTALHRLLQMRGWVHGVSLAQLYDKINVINEAFDPVKSYLADTGATFNRGYMALDFDVPTADTGNYATGLVASRYYVQALRPPVSANTKFAGFSARIDFLLRAADPRRYWQTSSSVNRTGPGTLAIPNTLASYPSWPIFTILTPAGAPTGTWTIQRTTGLVSGTISINGALLAASTSYTLDTQAKTFIETNTGVSKIAAISGASQFFDIRAGVSDTITFAVFAAGATLTVTWRRAFV